MKNSRNLLLAISSLCLLCSCGEKSPSKSSSSSLESSALSNPSSVPSESTENQSADTSGESGQQKDGYTRFTEAMASSRPSKVNTQVYYSLPSDGVTLSMLSSLTVSYEGGTIYTEYVYTKEKLNDSSAETFISTENGTITSNGDNVYGVINGNTSWNTTVEGYVCFLTFTLSDFTVKEPSITETSLGGQVIAGRESIFFGSGVSVTGVVFSITLNAAQKVSSVNLAFSTSLGASVTSSSTYTY